MYQRKKKHRLVRKRGKKVKKKWEKINSDKFVEKKKNGNRKERRKEGETEK